MELALDGGNVAVRVADLAWGKGTISLYLDDAHGQRHLATSSALSDGAVGATVLTYAPSSEDAELRVTVLFRGVDARGEALVVSREQLLVRAN